MGLGASEQVGKAIAQTMNNQQRIEADFIADDVNQSMLLVNSERVKVSLKATGKKRTITNTFIVGHPIYGLVGDEASGAFPIGNPAFILGHPTWGILGECSLGAQGTYSEEVIFIYES